MEKAFIIEYIESERFSRFIKKQKVEVLLDGTRVSIYVKSNTPGFTDDDHIEYKLDHNTDTLKYLYTYQIDGVENLAAEIEYPDELREVISYISENIK